MKQVYNNINISFLKENSIDNFDLFETFRINSSFASFLHAFIHIYTLTYTRVIISSILLLGVNCHINVICMIFLLIYPQAVMFF